MKNSKIMIRNSSGITSAIQCKQGISGKSDPSKIRCHGCQDAMSIHEYLDAPVSIYVTWNVFIHAIKPLHGLLRPPNWCDTEVQNSSLPGVLSTICSYSHLGSVEHGVQQLEKPGKTLMQFLLKRSLCTMHVVRKIMTSPEVQDFASNELRISTWMWWS